MVYALTIMIMLLASAGVSWADDFKVWIHGSGTATTNQVFVNAVWFDQFPNKDDNTDRQIGLAIPVNYWNSLSIAQRIAIRSGLNKLLTGEIRVTRASLLIWRNALANANIKTDLVMPGEMPTIGARLYIVIVGQGEYAAHRFNSFGLTREAVW